ncbi:rod shape-determining protein MreD [Marivita hallyeonensis]|uniref:Rod shape-determining protein MreD n=1 Tax=Marivita hallyeonensis TaxID=996342 RepID=A0A1M5WYQ6_9RHOB|nr:rod shape-determining protein MreD [Marivita hallyeonensis]SHH92438.1 rod shape-determining protein MreD [Marivita hallyeonensis]
MDQNLLQLWGMRAAFAFTALVILFFHLLPLDAAPSRWAGPDVLTAMVFAWAVRRPDYVPIVLIALVMLIADFLLQRPPGLWSVLVLCAAEWLKSRERRQRETTFALEWLTFAGTLIVITLLYRAVMMVLILAPGTLTLSLIQVAMTIAVYPLVVGVSYFVFGVRRSAPGDVDRLGRGL